MSHHIVCLSSSWNKTFSPQISQELLSVLARYKIGWEHILLTIVVVLGLAVRFHEVHYNLDGDEIFSVELASKQFVEVISLSLQDRPHPPLHNVFLHLWIKGFGASE